MPYKLPDNIPPDELQCIKVWIPTDPQWSSVFWGAFHELTRWWNFERDDEHKAALVSNFWRGLWIMAEEAHASGDGCEDSEMPCIHRLKPGQWWVTQESCDGGLSWVDIIRQCCGPEDGPGGPPSGGGDTYNIYLSTIIMRFWFMYWINLIFISIGDGDTRPEFEDKATTELGPEANAEVIDKLGDAFDYAETMDPDTLEAMATAECEWTNQHRCLEEYFANTDPDWLDRADEWLACALNSLDDALVDVLNDAAEAIGGGFDEFIFRKSGGGGGAGFGLDGGCDWIVVALGPLTKTVPPQSTPECGEWTVDCPAGYRLSGVYWEYSSNGNDSSTSPRVHPGIDPNCGPFAPDKWAWQNTSAFFGKSYAKTYMMLNGLTETAVFTDNGFDLTGVAPTGRLTPVYNAADHLGPAMLHLPVTWRPTTTVGVFASITGWAILQKYP